MTGTFSDKWQVLLGIKPWKKYFVPTELNCTIWFLWIRILICAKAGEEKALGNSFQPRASRKWFPTGLVPYHESTGSAKPPSSAATVWESWGAVSAGQLMLSAGCTPWEPLTGLWDGDKGNGTTTAPGLASQCPHSSASPAPPNSHPADSSQPCQRIYCNWSVQQTQGWLPLTHLPFPMSPRTCYLLSKLTK